jgi:hypothetical protein
MRPSRLRPVLLVAVAAALISPTGPAAAQVQGPCTAWFNGVEAERIDSLSSPLLLGDDEALVFSGTDSAGTRNAAVQVFLGPARLGDNASSSTAPAAEFLASLDLADVAPYGVGLLRIRATTDNCTVEAWLRLGGRLPFSTLVGLTGIVLALGGLGAQIGAVVARRRWLLPVAAAAGVATGAGGALLGQEFGRLQLSYPSLGICVAGAVLAGVVLALLRRPRREAGSRAAAPDSEAPRPLAPGEIPPPAAVSPAEPAAAPAAAAAKPAAGPFWCYVMAEVEVLHLDDYSRVVAVLHPGTWYLAKREISGWAQVVAADGTEGWAPRQALHREG